MQLKTTTAKFKLVLFDRNPALDSDAALKGLALSTPDQVLGCQRYTVKTSVTRTPMARLPWMIRMILLLKLVFIL